MIFVLPQRACWRQSCKEMPCLKMCHSCSCTPSTNEQLDTKIIRYHWTYGRLPHWRSIRFLPSLQQWSWWGYHLNWRPARPKLLRKTFLIQPTPPFFAGVLVSILIQQNRHHKAVSLEVVDMCGCSIGPLWNSTVAISITCYITWKFIIQNLWYIQYVI